MKSKMCVAMAFGFLASLSQPAFAIDGTITFTGAVSANTCTINGNSTGSQSFNVLLPTVGVDSLISQGQTAGNTPFVIRLSACTPNTGTVRVHFEPGANGNTVTGNLTTAAGGAGNVEVRLLNSDESAINVTVADGSQNSKSIVLASGEATLRYIAQYFATGQASPGTVTATAKYTIVYQ